MPREIITIECTEAKKEGKSPSRYTTTRNKKLQTDKLELMKFNPSLRRHTLHREIK
jgi:large subunit ribosomal protein L33